MAERRPDGSWAGTSRSMSSAPSSSSSPHIPPPVSALSAGTFGSLLRGRGALGGVDRMRDAQLVLPASTGASLRPRSLAHPSLSAKASGLLSRVRQRSQEHHHQAHRSHGWTRPTIPAASSSSQGVETAPACTQYSHGAARPASSAPTPAADTPLKLVARLQGLLRQQL